MAFDLLAGARTCFAITARISGIGPEPELRAGDVLARVVQRVLLDPRVLALALDVVDAVGAPRIRRPSTIEYVVAVERADGRAGGAVALGVVLAAVARAAEAGRLAPASSSATSLPGLVLLDSSTGSSSTGPFGCTGQPRCAQRFERIVKLGWPCRARPLLRMYAVRRETSPASGSSTKVVMMNWPSGKSESGPRSIGWNFGPRTPRRRASRAAGS